MKKISPYNNLKEALSILDNGGRFYNILTTSNDDVIEQAELRKVGGLFNDKQKMILYLEMATIALKSEEKEVLLSKLDEDLKTTYLKYKPQQLLPSEASEKGKLASNVILKGVPELIDSKSDFNGFIMVPIMVGRIMILSMIPIIDNYKVYELRDEKTSKTFLIAHSKESEPLPNQKITIAGVLKEIKTSTDKNGQPDKFLEANYYIANGDSASG